MAGRDYDLALLGLEVLMIGYDTMAAHNLNAGAFLRKPGYLEFNMMHTLAYWRVLVKHQWL